MEVNQLPIYLELQDHIRQERDDYTWYNKIANTLIENGFNHEAGILKDIADEELYHSKLIQHILKEEHTNAHA